MPTVNAGSTGSTNTVGPFNSILITNNHNDAGRWWFTPTDLGNPTNPFMAATGPFGGVSDTIGPIAGSIIVGPFGVPGTIFVQCETGSIFYGVTSARIGPVQTDALSATGSVTFNSGSMTVTPSNANVTIAPTGTGVLTLNSGAQGLMNNVEIGAITRRNAGFTAIYVNLTDSSGTPGNVTNNAGKGRVAIAAGASSVTVTNSVSNASASVFAVIAQATADATLTQIVRAVPTAGAFTLYGNAAATANVIVDFIVFGA